MNKIVKKAEKTYFDSKDLKTAWTNEYLTAASDANVNRIELLKEVRAQQDFEIQLKTVRAKNISTAAGVAVAAGILFKEYGGVVASKALPMVSRFL